MTKSSQGAKGKAAPQSLSSGATYDWGLLTVVITLLALGLVMVFSASFAQGIEGFDDPYYFAIRQLIWTVIGLAALVVTARVPYMLWERWSIPLMAVALVALMAVIAFGSDRYGSVRTFIGGSIQPSEPAKIAIIIYISTWLASKGPRIREIQVGLVPFSVLLGAVTVLIVSQPDISTAILIVATASVMFFIAGADLRQLLLMGAGTAATFGLVINFSTYARGRVERYLDSIWDPLLSNEWQVQQGMQALLRGGIFGTGIGNSTAKMPGVLPVSWSDNIFAVIGEELGLIGTLLVIFLFAILAYRGLQIALRARDNFGMLVATGITSLLILQAILNAAVIVAVAPPTGVTLPFISYGGSSLVTTLAGIGILLSVSRYSGQGASQSSNMGQLAYARFDFGWRDRRSRVSRAGGGGAARASGRSVPPAHARRATSRAGRNRSS